RSVRGGRAGERGRFRRDDLALDADRFTLAARAAPVPRRPPDFDPRQIIGIEALADRIEPRPAVACLSEGGEPRLLVGGCLLLLPGQHLAGAGELLVFRTNPKTVESLSRLRRGRGEVGERERLRPGN